MYNDKNDDNTSNDFILLLMKIIHKLTKMFEKILKNLNNS